MTINRCPSVSRNMNSSLSTSCGNLLGTRRPLSCNGSSESLPSFLPSERREEKYFCCPAGNECYNVKLASTALIQHINEVHQLPAITFGCSSAEIFLPPRAPIENASLILLLDGKQFWVKVASL